MTPLWAVPSVVVEVLVPPLAAYAHDAWAGFSLATSLAGQKSTMSNPLACTGADLGS